MKVIIVGGGIGGLATYHSLQKYFPGATVKVYEAHASPTDTTSVLGGGLGIVPNGLRALSQVCPSSLKYLYEHGYSTTFFTIRNDNGTTLGRLGGLADRIMMSRAAVHESLLLGMPDTAVEWGKKVLQVQENAGNVFVAFDDGQNEFCDLVVGADGVRSVCRQAIFGKDAYPAKYDGLTAVGGFIPFASLTPLVQTGICADQAAMTFSRNGFFGYSLSLPAATSPGEQQVMWWSTYAVETPPERDQPPEDIHAILNAKHGSWKSPHGRTFQEIIDSACRDTSSNSRFTKWLVLPRYQTDRLPRWTSDGGRIVLMGDAAHTTSPDSGQGVSVALEDAQMLGMLLKHYLPSEGEADEITISKALAKVSKTYESMRIPRVGRILDMAKRQGDGKRQISWFAAKMRDFFLWLMCKLPISWLLKINPTHLYDVNLEVEKYLASEAHA